MGITQLTTILILFTSDFVFYLHYRKVEFNFCFGGGGGEIVANNVSQYFTGLL